LQNYITTRLHILWSPTKIASFDSTNTPKRREKGLTLVSVSSTFLRTSEHPKPEEKVRHLNVKKGIHNTFIRVFNVVPVTPPRSSRGLCWRLNMVALEIIFTQCLFLCTNFENFLLLNVYVYNSNDLPPTIEIDHRQIFSGVLCAWVGSCILARMYDAEIENTPWQRLFYWEYCGSTDFWRHAK